MKVWRICTIYSYECKVLLCLKIRQIQEIVPVLVDFFTCFVFIFGSEFPLDTSASKSNDKQRFPPVCDSLTKVEIDSITKNAKKIDNIQN